MYTSSTVKIADIIRWEILFDFKEFTWLIKSHSTVASKRQTCLGYMQIWNLSRNKSGSSLGGFSVVKHLYSLEIALYCYKELRRNILDFWSRFKTKNLRKLNILRFHARSVICIKNRHRIPKRAGRPSQGTFKFYRVADWPIRQTFFVSTNNK